MHVKWSLHKGSLVCYRCICQMVPSQRQFSVLQMHLSNGPCTKAVQCATDASPNWSLHKSSLDRSSHWWMLFLSEHFFHFVLSCAFSYFVNSILLLSVVLACDCLLPLSDSSKNGTSVKYNMSDRSCRSLRGRTRITEHNVRYQYEHT